MRISDWSSDVCSSDLRDPQRRDRAQRRGQSREIVVARDFDRAQRCEVIGLKLAIEQREAAVFEARDQPGERDLRGVGLPAHHALAEKGEAEREAVEAADEPIARPAFDRMCEAPVMQLDERSEEQTSELQSLMRISNAVFCLNT